MPTGIKVYAVFLCPLQPIVRVISLAYFIRVINLSYDQMYYNGRRSALQRNHGIPYERVHKQFARHEQAVLGLGSDPIGCQPLAAYSIHSAQ